MTQLEYIPFDDLVALLDNDKGKAANREYAKRVYENNGEAVVHYMTKLNERNISYISNVIMHRDIYTDYYEFLSNPVEHRVPKWHRVRLYKGEDECTLKSYTATIASRKFCRIAKQEADKRKKATAYSDNIDYESLKSCETLVDDEPEDVDSRRVQRKKGLKIAFEQLTERDRVLIDLLIFKKMNNMDAYDLFSKYIHPKTKSGLDSDEIKKQKTKYQKSTYISGEKGRALTALNDLFKDVIAKSQQGVYNLNFYYDATIYFSDKPELLDEYYLQVMQRGFNRLSPHMQNILISLLQNHVSPVEVYDSLRQKFPELKKDFKSGLNKDEKIEFINRVKGKALKIWESYCPTKIM